MLSRCLTFATLLLAGGHAWGQNNSTLIQEGKGNQASVFQRATYDAPNMAYMTQIGNSNTLLLTQDSERERGFSGEGQNLSVVEQLGHDNQATVSIVTGAGNTTHLTQQGNGNEAMQEFSEESSMNAAGIEQRGNYNKASQLITVLVRGYGISRGAYIQQTGNYHLATQTLRTNIDSELDVQQEGSANESSQQDQEWGVANRLTLTQSGQKNVGIQSATGYVLLNMQAEQSGNNNYSLQLTMDGFRVDQAQSNTMQTTQLGNNNFLVQFSDGSFNSQTILQQGNANTGHQSTYSFTHDERNQGNTQHLTQIGRENYTEQDIFMLSHENTTTTLQIGNENIAWLFVAGELNTADTQQKGNTNRAIIEQNGNGHLGIISQTGNHHHAQLVQQGNNQEAIVVQNGSHNTIIITQE